MEFVQFGNVNVGMNYRPYIVAEIGSNHNGDMGLCKRLIDAAADAGADAVKFQSWSEKSLIAEEEYERNTQYNDKKRHFGTLREMVSAYQFTPDQHYEAYRHCEGRGIAFSSSCFSEPEVDLLNELAVPFLKIASMDVTNLPLLSYAARTKRPLVISTGMATLGEIEKAVRTVRAAGNEQIVLLHCVSLYPPEDGSVNLRNMATLRAAFALPTGYSDHTLGVPVALGAVALGACMIEKHFTLDKDMAGWDHAISADPNELTRIVADTRRVFDSLGSSERRICERETEKRKQLRRSLVAKNPLERGHKLRQGDLVAKRPGTGIPPDMAEYVIGRTMAVDINEDEVLRWTHIS